MSDDKEIDDLIVFYAAECWHQCQDRHCIYTHWDSWEVDGQHYRTEAEARDAARLLLKAEPCP